jgi:ABC-type Fe3+/spermidine/putrescine transport system ATPase subunit
MVFQSYAVWPHMTVTENIAYPLRVRRVRRAQIREKVARVVELLHLDGLADRNASRLSGGQQQRVALARALVYEPEVLLLDEPFSNLDAKLRDKLRLEVKLLQRTLGITVVFVTHDQLEALSLSDRVAVMNHGRVEQIGTPLTVYEQPATPFVRDFLGRAVMLPGDVERLEDDGLVVRLDAGATWRARPGGEVVEPGDRVWVSLRPEDVELRRAGTDGGEAVRGRVEAVLFVGEHTEVTVDVGDDRRVLAFAPRHAELGEGQEVLVGSRPGAASVWRTGRSAADEVDESTTTDPAPDFGESATQVV